MREENRSIRKKLFEDRREPNKEAHTITRCKQIHPTLDQQQQAQYSVNELTTRQSFQPYYPLWVACMHSLFTAQLQSYVCIFVYRPYVVFLIPLFS
jgi:hypothetical protein